MKIAKVTDCQVEEIKEASEWGVLPAPYEQRHLDAAGLTECHSCLPYDPATHKLVSCDPYVLDALVYDVEVVPKNDADIAEDKVSALSNLKDIRNRLLYSTDWAELSGARGRIGDSRLGSRKRH
jgi:hypothetical protein